MQVDQLIIGAGPAGLAVAGRMRHLKIPFVILEAGQQVGVSWRKHYDRLHLHTVKQWSHLPHKPFPSDYPTYVSRDQLIQYLDDYAAEFKIQPVFNQNVCSVEKSDKGWQVTCERGDAYQANNVIVATGVNRVPNIPEWKGQESYRGTILHSRYYRNPDPFAGRQVLVIGMGNTGAEVALDLANHGVKTFISVRGPISIVPRDLNGRPVQVTSKQLAKLPFGLGDWLGSQIRKIYFGNLEKYGLSAAKAHPAVQLRETGKTPVIDVGTIEAIKQKKITVVPEIDRYYEKGVFLSNGEQIAVDRVILATGYYAQIEKIIPACRPFLDQNGLPKMPIAPAPLEGLYFIGFDNYKLGGILGTIYTDSEEIVRHINEKHK